MKERETSPRPLQLLVSGPIYDAVNSLAMASSRLSELQPGGIPHWAGAWGDYQDVNRLMMKAKALAERIERQETAADKFTQRQVREDSQGPGEPSRLPLNTANAGVQP